MKTIIIIMIFILSVYLISGDTLTLQDANTENLEDSYVSEVSKDTNYGSDSTMASSNRTSAGAERISFIKFNISSLPDGVTITYANLSIYMDNRNEVRSQSVYNTSDFSEGSITWNTIPSFDTFQDSQSSAADNTWNSWNVTGAVISSYSNEANVSLMINGSKTAIGLLDYYRTKEHGTSSTRPKLEITYTEVTDDVSERILSLGSSDYLLRGNGRFRIYG